MEYNRGHLYRLVHKTITQNVLLSNKEENVCSRNLIANAQSYTEKSHNSLSLNRKFYEYLPKIH